MPPKKRKQQNKDAPPEKILKRNNETPRQNNELYWSFAPRILLGRGSFGDVEVQYNHSKGFLCATKIFRDKDAFEFELKTVRQLNHINVISLIDENEDQLVLHLKIASYTLEDLIERNQLNTLGLSEMQVKMLIKDMLNALDYVLNDLKLVHRDIKPANILFDENTDSFKLGDFGLATPYDIDTLSFDDIVRGTPAFIHPKYVELLSKEQTQKHSICIDADIWSLAVCFFNAATGKLPFFSRTRGKWIQLAKDKPNGSICVDDEGKYKYEIDTFNRLSDGYRTHVFQPLLIFMMSDKATFIDLFERSNRDRINKDSLSIFNLNSFEVIYLPYEYGRTSIRTAISKECESKDPLIMCDNGITSDEYIIPKFNSHMSLTVLTTKYCSENISQEHIKHTYFAAFDRFFKDRISKQFKEKEVQCVFSNVFQIMNTLTKQARCFERASQILITRAKSFQKDLSLLYDCFESDLNSLFSLQNPESSFATFINQFKQEVNKIISDEYIFKCESFEQLETDFNLSTCKQYMDFLKMETLSAVCKDHVFQIKSIFDVAIDSLLQHISTIIQYFFKWLSEMNSKILHLQEYSSKTQYMHSEIIKRIVNEIESVGINVE